MSSSGGGSGGGSSIYLVSDPRMERHRPVPPPSGQSQHRQLDPPCERPERLSHIMDRLGRLERSLIGLRGGGGEITTSAPSVAAVPFVKSNCRPVKRETGELQELRTCSVAPMRGRLWREETTCTTSTPARLLPHVLLLHLPIQLRL